MVFNSYTFAVFFALVLTLYWSLRSWPARKILLLVSSYLFYAAWDPAFVALLWLSTGVDWAAARNIDRHEGRMRKRLWLALSLSVNLGLLAYFKYGGFILENFVFVVQTLGIDYAPAGPNIILPIGISFYTFQTLSYTIDVYRGDLKPGRSMLDFALYVTFFPQLVAGPIVRARDFLPQCLAAKTFKSEWFTWGLILLLIGLFEKNVLADGVFAEPVQRVYSNVAGASRLDLIVAMFGFSCQVFFDFAGYSTCAIGAALCLGFRLPDNFRWPLCSLGFTELWSRWHISLSTWVRDYFYIPLGGSRGSDTRVSFNLVATMWVMGLWHGASWNYVIWGGINGLYMMIERLIMRAQGMKRFRNEGLFGVAGATLTFIVFSMTLVVFRCRSLAEAWLYLKRLMIGVPAGALDLVSRVEAAYVVGLAALAFLSHWLLREESLESFYGRLRPWQRVLGLMVIVYFLLTHTSADSAFIYFQF